MTRTSAQRVWCWSGGQARSGALLTLFFATLLFVTSVEHASASDGTLYLWPNTGTYTTDTDLTLRILVNSGGEPVNAIEGKLLYDPRMLEVSSTDQGSSVVASWTVKPEIDNEKGTIMFGGLLATSTILERGEALLLHLRALRSGDAEIGFESGSAAVRAADGTGGNILSVLGRGIYRIVPSEGLPEALPPEDDHEVAGEVLGAATELTITSLSHPDEKAWYATSTGVFSWELFPNTAKTLLSLNERSSGRGSIPYSPPIDTKAVTGLDDGVQFLHVTLRSDLGEEESATYRIQVDTEVPVIAKFEEVPRAEPTDPNITLLVDATDQVSGIDHYEFSVDGGAWIHWQDDGSHHYKAGVLPPGEHKINVAAVDRAGNRAERSLTATVTHLPPPVIALASPDPREGMPLELTLTATPRSTVQLLISRNEEKPVSEGFSIGESGSGSFRSALILSPGTYRITGTAHGANGAISAESVPLSVESRSSLAGLIKRHPTMIFVLLGLIATFFVSLVLWRRFKKAKREVGEVFPPASFDDEAPLAASKVSEVVTRPAPLSRARPPATVLPKMVRRQAIVPERVKR